MGSDSHTELISMAKALVKPMQLSRDDLDACTVGCAIKSVSGRIYTGICIHLSCGIGFCAEHAAMAEMIKCGETEIDTIVAANKSEVLSPCGRCREMMVQINNANFNANVVLKHDRVVKLRDLLPEHWMGS